MPWNVLLFLQEELSARSKDISITPTGHYQPNCGTCRSRFSIEISSTKFAGQQLIISSPSDCNQLNILAIFVYLCFTNQYESIEKWVKFAFGHRRVNYRTGLSNSDGFCESVLVCVAALKETKTLVLPCGAWKADWLTVPAFIFKHYVSGLRRAVKTARSQIAVQTLPVDHRLQLLSPPYYDCSAGKKKYIRTFTRLQSLLNKKLVTCSLRKVLAAVYVLDTFVRWRSEELTSLSLSCLLSLILDLLANRLTSHLYVTVHQQDCKQTTVQRLQICALCNIPCDLGVFTKSRPCADIFDTQFSHCQCVGLQYFYQLRLIKAPGIQTVWENQNKTKLKICTACNTQGCINIVIKNHSVSTICDQTKRAVVSSSPFSTQPQLNSSTLPSNLPSTSSTAAQQLPAQQLHAPAAMNLDFATVMSRAALKLWKLVDWKSVSLDLDQETETDLMNMCILIRQFQSVNVNDFMFRANPRVDLTSKVRPCGKNVTATSNVIYVPTASSTAGGLQSSISASALPDTTAGILVAESNASATAPVPAMPVPDDDPNPVSAVPGDAVDTTAVALHAGQPILNMPILTGDAVDSAPVVSIPSEGSDAESTSAQPPKKRRRKLNDDERKQRELERQARQEKKLQEEAEKKQKAQKLAEERALKKQQEQEKKQQEQEKREKKRQELEEKRRQKEEKKKEAEAKKAEALQKKQAAKAEAEEKKRQEAEQKQQQKKQQQQQRAVEKHHQRQDNNEQDMETGGAAETGDKPQRKIKKPKSKKQRKEEEEEQSEQGGEESEADDHEIVTRTIHHDIDKVAAADRKRLADRLRRQQQRKAKAVKAGKEFIDMSADESGKSDESDNEANEDQETQSDRDFINDDSGDESEEDHAVRLKYQIKYNREGQHKIVKNTSKGSVTVSEDEITEHAGDPEIEQKDEEGEEEQDAEGDAAEEEADAADPEAGDAECESKAEARAEEEADDESNHAGMAVFNRAKAKSARRNRIQSSDNDESDAEDDSTEEKEKQQETMRSQIDNLLTRFDEDDVSQTAASPANTKGKAAPKKQTQISFKSSSNTSKTSSGGKSTASPSASKAASSASTSLASKAASSPSTSKATPSSSSKTSEAAAAQSITGNKKDTGIAKWTKTFKPAKRIKFI